MLCATRNSVYLHCYSESIMYFTIRELISNETEIVFSFIILTLNMFPPSTATEIQYYIIVYNTEFSQFTLTAACGSRFANCNIILRENIR